jgi:hypothetical protein
MGLGQESHVGVRIALTDADMAIDPRSWRYP